MTSPDYDELRAHVQRIADALSDIEHKIDECEEYGEQLDLEYDLIDVEGGMLDLREASA